MKIYRKLKKKITSINYVHDIIPDIPYRSNYIHLINQDNRYAESWLFNEKYNRQNRYRLGIMASLSGFDSFTTDIQFTIGYIRFYCYPNMDFIQ